MVTTTVHLLRHGEVHNPTGVLYGRLDGYHLSERGVAMAERIAAHLAGTGPDGAPRRRARGGVTAAPGAGDRGPDRGRLRAGGRRRPAPDRGGEPLRGTGVRGR